MERWGVGAPHLPNAPMPSYQHATHCGLKMDRTFELLSTSSDAPTRQSAAEGIARIGGKEAVKLLVETYLWEKHLIVKDSIYEVIVSLGNEAIEPLIEDLGHDSDGVTALATRILGEIGSEKAVFPLRMRIEQLSLQYTRYGYRRTTGMLRRENEGAGDNPINHKRVHLFRFPFGLGKALDTGHTPESGKSIRSMRALRMRRRIEATCWMFVTIMNVSY